MRIEQHVNEHDTWSGAPSGIAAQLALVFGPSARLQVVRSILAVDEVEGTLLISCIGRKLVMKQRVEEEVEAVRDSLDAGTVLAGFYSLHNQTMTVTTFAES